jgi:hypothetical protein
MPGFPFTLHLGETTSLTSAVVPGLLYNGKPVNLHGIAVNLAPDRQRSSKRSRTLTINAPYAREMYRCSLKESAFESGLIFSGIHVPGEFASTVAIVTERHGTVYLRSLGPRLIHVLPEVLPTISSFPVTSSRRSKFVENLRRCIPQISSAPMIFVSEIMEIHVNYLARDGVEASLECNRIAVVASMLAFTSAAGKIESAAILPNPVAVQWDIRRKQEHNAATNPGPTAYAPFPNKLTTPAATAVPAVPATPTVPAAPAVPAVPAAPAVPAVPAAPAVPAVPAAPAVPAVPAAQMPFPNKLIDLAPPPVSVPCAPSSNQEYMIQLRQRCMVAPSAGTFQPGPQDQDTQPVVDAFLERLYEEQRTGYHRTMHNRAATAAQPAIVTLPPATDVVLTEALLSARDSIVPLQTLCGTAERKVVPDHPPSHKPWSERNVYRSLQEAIAAQRSGARQEGVVSIAGDDVVDATDDDASDVVLVEEEVHDDVPPLSGMAPAGCDYDGTEWARGIVTVENRL